MTDFQADRKYIINTLHDLVHINSVNPSLVPGAPGEREIAEYVYKAMKDLSLEVSIQEIAPGRFNVIGKLAGRGRGRSLMLNAHMDTVGVYDMDKPFSPRIQNGKLYGRGAFDMKGSLAACLGAVKSLVDNNIHLSGDLYITAVADEEYISIGTENIVKQFTTDGAIVTEPTGLRTCIAHKGYEWIEIETIGKAAHGSRYKVGVDANLIMGHVLTKLDILAKELLMRPPHPLAGPPSLHTSTLHGGTEWSIYPDRCKLQIERRTIPGETTEVVINEIQILLDELEKENNQFKAEMNTFFSRQPFEISQEAQIVRSVQQSGQKHLGHSPLLIGESFWMDSAILASAGIETVIFGPSGGGAHAQVEWVNLDSVYDTACILAYSAENYCNHPEG